MPLRILVVDDAPDVLELFVVTLRAAGYEVVEALSVHQALSTLRAGTPVDVLIADYNLGDGTGMELIHQARNERATPGRALPAILCTAYRYVELPPDVAMLHKPVDPPALLEALVATLARGQVA